MISYKITNVWTQIVVDEQGEFDVDDRHLTVDDFNEMLACAAGTIFGEWEYGCSFDRARWGYVFRSGEFGTIEVGKFTSSVV